MSKSLVVTRCSQGARHEGLVSINRKLESSQEFDERAADLFLRRLQGCARCGGRGCQPQIGAGTLAKDVNKINTSQWTPCDNAKKRERREQGG